jgi:hypothetical protein
MTRSLALAFAAAAGVAATAADALANPPCTGPFCNQSAYPRYSLFGHGNKNLPAFQAAPWYLYWPYDAHFLTPAPVTGAFYGPPTPGNFPVNPYFPGPAYGHYGPIPGGPAPGGVGFGGAYPAANYPSAPPPTGEIPMPIAPTGPAPRP